MASIADLLAKAKPQERTVRVVVDGTLASAFIVADHAQQLAVAALVTAERDSSSATSLGGDPATVELRVAVDVATAATEAARAALDAGMDTFTIQFPGYAAWADLQAAHPPRPGKPEDVAWNDVTFVPASIALGCVDPVMTGDDAAQLLAVMSIADRSALFKCVLEASIGAVSVPR